VSHRWGSRGWGGKQRSAILGFNKKIRKKRGWEKKETLGKRKGRTVPDGQPKPVGQPKNPKGKSNPRMKGLHAGRLGVVNRLKVACGKRAKL